MIFQRRTSHGLFKARQNTGSLNDAPGGGEDLPGLGQPSTTSPPSSSTTRTFYNLSYVSDILNTVPSTHRQLSFVLGSHD